MCPCSRAAYYIPQAWLALDDYVPEVTGGAKENVDKFAQTKEKRFTFKSVHLTCSIKYRRGDVYVCNSNEISLARFIREQRKRTKIPHWGYKESLDLMKKTTVSAWVLVYHLKCFQIRCYCLTCILFIFKIKNLFACLLSDRILILNISGCINSVSSFLDMRDLKELLICLSIRLSVYLQNNSIFFLKDFFGTGHNIIGSLKYNGKRR